MIMSLSLEAGQATKGQRVTASGKTDSAPSSALSAQNDPDLARVVAAWPELPEAIRADILAMVQHAEKQAENSVCERPPGRA